MSTSEHQRSELLQELLRFEPFNERHASYRDWRLPSQWKWDAKGGSRGQLHSSANDFTGVEYPDFTLEKSIILGKGAFGEVRRVLCNGKLLARKKVLIDINRPRRAVPNTKEIQALKQVSHHHVSQIVGLYVLGNDLYSLSYPVAEMSLHDYMSLRRILDPTWVNTLVGGMGCLSSALAYMHSVGVKHRDIHNENVLVLGGCMIFCDFGGAVASQSPPLSLHYESSGDEDARALDVSRLGTLFGEMLGSIYDRDQTSYPDQLTALDRPKLRSFSGASKQIDRVDFWCLFQIMTAVYKKPRPTAALVSQYLRLGYFEWAFLYGQPNGEGEIFCNTCGDCCKE